jgi:large subunit ribosomal protein L10
VTHQSVHHKYTYRGKFIFPLVGGIFYERIYMATQKKIDTVNELTTKVQKSKSMVFTQYSGLKHKQLEELRKNVKKIDGEFVVTKNKLIQRVMADQKTDTGDVLKEATATLFAYNDEVAPLKVLLKFFKTAGIGKVKGGILGKQMLTEAEVNRLAMLPNKEQLLGKLVGQLNAPIQGLHHALSWNLNKLVWALNSIKNKKSN